MGLQGILQSHTHILGNDFSRLGRASGYYLCYRSGHFTLVYRSYWHRIFEKLLDFVGCKTGTDLRTVAEHIDREPDISRLVIDKIHASWSRTYPQCTAPFSYRDAVERRPVPAPPLAPLQEVAQPIAAPVFQPYRLRVGTAILSLERGKITKAPVQAIVNPADRPRNFRKGSFNGPEGSVSREIFEAAGAAALAKECGEVLLEHMRQRNIDMQVAGRPLPDDLFVERTSSGSLSPPIQHILHVVSPHYDPETDFTNRANLKLAIRDVLYVAKESDIKSLAFPLFDRWGYPALLVVETCWDALQECLHENPGIFDEIKLVIDGTPTFFRDAKERAESKLRPFSEKV